MVPAIIAHEGKNRLGELRWGLIPSWVKEKKIGFQTFNAKAETVPKNRPFVLPFSGNAVSYRQTGSMSGKSPVQPMSPTESC
jgi:putative SOS response-associated peptidase YedK